MSRNRLLDENAVCLYKMDRDGAAREEDFYRAAYELLKAVRPDVGKRVVMKPNVTVPAEPDSGIITHPTFVRGVVAYLEEVGVRIEDMVIAEGGGSGPPHRKRTKGHFPSLWQHWLALGGRAGRLLRSGRSARRW